MTPVQFEQAQRAFLSLRGKSRQEIEPKLSEIARSDAEVMRAVVSLLEGDTPEPHPLDSPVLGDHLRVKYLLDHNLGEIPQRLGPYRVLRPIQRGGMGSVYLAVRDDDHLRTHVALKVIRRGLDTEDILHRFQQERQLLAALSHPNIARVMDAGVTEDGRPYFVMEYVQGEPIDKYCDAQQLTVVERLRLFQKVCSAVQYAHQHLIVHRDIKPGNILVTAEGEPKLMDFGIAKVLNPEMFGLPVMTSPDMLLMTPEYASPEQALGKTVTTTSDVYSLGVLLYELLTGHSPYHFGRLVRDEMIRMICEVEPEKPSTRVTRPESIDLGNGTSRIVTPKDVAEPREGQPQRLRRKLAGDLDNIVLMAMRKVARRRYESAGQFGEDIQRHLDGRAVMARPETWVYMLGKFVRRNRTPVAAAALVALSLTGGVAATAWQWNQTAVALKEMTEARERAGIWTDLVFTTIRNDASESVATRASLLAKTKDYLARLESGSAHGDDYMRDLARAHAALGELYGLHGPNTGQKQESLGHFREAAELRRRLYESSGHSAGTASDLALALSSLAEITQALNDVVEAERLFQESIDLAETLPRSGADAAKHDRVRGICQKQLADLRYQQEQLDAALTAYSSVETTRRRLSVANPGDAVLARDLSVVLQDIGQTWQKMIAGGAATSDDASTQAFSRFDECIRIRERLNADSTSPRTQRDLYSALRKKAEFLRFLGKRNKDPARFNEALLLASTAYPIIERLTEPKPEDIRTLTDLARFHELKGKLLAETFDALAPTTRESRHDLLVGARTELAECRALWARMATRVPGDPAVLFELASACYSHGETLQSGSEDPSLALDAMETARKTLAKVPIDYPSRARYNDLSERIAKSRPESQR